MTVIMKRMLASSLFTFQANTIQYQGGSLLKIGTQNDRCNKPIYGGKMFKNQNERGGEKERETEREP
jgi:hypothetical protein